jgi:hybrid cluster-associated redox disulfide protein
MKITGNMTIQEILEKNEKKASKIAETMVKHGMHCVGCLMAHRETLKQGSLGHGMSKEEFERMLKELNKIVGGK